jgi:outer membrane protein
MTMKPGFLFLRVCGVAALTLGLGARAASAADTASGPWPWPDRPLALADCLDIALEQNAAVRKSRQDIEAAHGLSLQTRAIVIPKVQASGEYGITEDRAVERLELPPNPIFPAGAPVIDPGNERWSAGVRLVQSIFEGGRLTSALRTARLLRDQALAQHRAVLADVVTEVRVAFYNVLLAEQEIRVAEAAVELLQKELEDNQRRFNAGTVPRFNVLRAEVELANARPRVSRARNAHRIAKNQLAHLLGFRVPGDLWDDIPLRLNGTLEAPRLALGVPEALAQALARRPELEAVRLAAQLRREGVQSARAGYLPRLQGYVGYGARKSMFSRELDDGVHGWEAGVQATWNVFDGALTRGKVAEARALLEKTTIEADDLARQIELEVRVAYSTLTEAWEVLESQKKVVEQAEEALRLARARADAGTGTQLDVLSAQTALTEARTTDVRARRDYAVAVARLERAIGAVSPEPEPPTAPAR